MIRLLQVFVFLFFPFLSQARFSPGFEQSEARDMIAICNSFTFLDLYGSDLDILPKGYEKVYTSEVYGMDNCFQVYRRGEVAVIHFRGSTDKKLSWLGNFYSSMIPAKGEIRIDKKPYMYCFARDAEAAVHSGYALSIVFSQNEILNRINELNAAGVYHFIITGHSQGGSLANLCRAWLENSSGGLVNAKNRFKTYAFAAPMTGNKAFAHEYGMRFADDGTSFNIVNPEDVIPGMPMSYNDTDFVRQNLNALLFGKEEFNFRKAMLEGTFRLFDDQLSYLMSRIGNSAKDQISKKNGKVEMPGYVKEINYIPLSKRVELETFDYPRILRDSSILKNDSLMAIYERGEDGFFTDESLYKKAPWGFAHKPYNYYVGILKRYYPQEYAALTKKFLHENL